MCPVPFNSARAFVALGSRWWKVPKYVYRQGAATKRTCLTVVGVEPKEGESPVGLFFIMDTTWPQGAAADRWNRITSSLPKFLQLSFNLTFISLFEKLIGCSRSKWRNPSAGYFFFHAFQFGPRIHTEGPNSSSWQIVGSSFLVTSPFPTLAKSSAALDRFDFFLEINFYIATNIFFFFSLSLEISFQGFFFSNFL